LKNSKIKVVYIINSLVTGGRENIVIDTCNYINDELFDIHLVTFVGGDEIQFMKLSPSVQIHDLGYKSKDLAGWRILLNWFGVLRKLTVLLQQLRPNVVHTHLLSHWVLLGAWAIKRSGRHIKHVHTVHTSGLYYSNGGLINRIRLETEKAAVRATHPTLVAVSDDVFKKLQKFFGRTGATLIKIYNGLDIEKFRKSALEISDSSLMAQIEGKCVVVYVARLDISKNHLLLLKAWKDVVSERPDSILILAGDGPQRVVIEDYIQTNKLTQSLILLGNRKDIAFILSQAQIAVFPSAFEGFAVSLLEKMAMKLPVIVSDIDAFTSIIEHKKNGIVVPLDNIAKLKGSILELINDEDLRKKIGVNGFNSIQRFSVENMINGYERIYLNDAN
jgi:glycosyltransferase involved in cell wall biosynthesis